MNPTETEFNALIDSHPNLCAWGWWSPRAARPMNLDLPMQRGLLRSEYQEFIHCIHWLRTHCTPTKVAKINSPTTSNLQKIAKHAETGYVGNGAMLAAVIYCEIPYKVFPADPNPSVAISWRSACFRTSPP